MELLSPDTVLYLRWLVFALLLIIVVALALPTAIQSIDDALSTMRPRKGRVSEPEEHEQTH